jgi:hypothetical protein
MPPLQVVSQPNNVPTLAPTVAPAPQQAPLQVQNAPAPQQAQLPVQTAPSEPQPQNLPVQPQPATQQQTVSVQLPPIVTAIQTAINRGADPTSILQAIAQQNPDKQPSIQTALSRGATPQQVLTEIVQQNSGIAQDAAPEHVGFVQSLIQSIARPFLRPAVGLYNAAAGAVKGLEGDVQGGIQATQQTRDLGYFGKIKPTSLQNIGEGAAKSFADTAGTGAEIAANFVGGEGAVGAGEDLIKGAAGAAVKQGIKEGAKTGALAGFGSGLQDQNASIKSVVEKTVGGAVGGAVTGGLITGLPALAIGTSKALKNTIAPSVEVALTKAIKPAKNNTGWFEAIKNVVPDIQETAAKAKLPINNLEDLSNVIKLTKDRLWKSYTEILGPHADSTIDGNQIADAMLNSLDKRTQVQNRGLVEKLIDKAATYRKPLSLSDAEDFLQSANNELHNFYAKNKVGQKVAASDPDVAPVLAEATALRDSLYSKLNDLTGKDAALLKKKYGDLSNIQTEVIGRKNVAARQNPDSLGAQLNTAQAVGNILESVADMKLGSAAKGVGQFAASKYLQRKNSTDGLIQSAFSRLGKH